jgi:xanthine phosphoribosyltransferase
MKYDYKLFIQDIELLTSMLQQKEFDTIVAIARGGLTLAHFLSNSLNIRNVLSINSIGYNNKSKNDTTVLLNTPNLRTSKRVLVVDDIVDSGDTMNLVLNELKKYNTTTSFISTALFYKKSASVKPDFYIHEATEWIEFFWENYQTAFNDDTKKDT